MLLGELGHRVKNTLAVVQAIAHQTLRTSPTPDDFVERFDGRLAALATAHELLMQSDWTGADLEALARQQFAAYTSEAAARVRFQGEPCCCRRIWRRPGSGLARTRHQCRKARRALERDGQCRRPLADAVRNQPAGIGACLGGARRSAENATRWHRLGSALIDSAIPGATVNREFLRTGLLCTVNVPIANPERDSATRPIESRCARLL